jgi:hypothetical protein
MEKLSDDELIDYYNTLLEFINSLQSTLEKSNSDE